MKMLYDILQEVALVHGGLPPYLLFMRKVSVDSMEEFVKKRTVFCGRLKSFGYLVKRDDRPLSILDLKSDLQDEMVSVI